jgi:preprotein translocase subunit SecA
MRRFGGDRIKNFMQWVGLDEDTPIENALLTKAITDVQKRVEGYHFDMRKHLVEYDDVVNRHRELIYGEREKILSGVDLKANILSMVREEVQGMVAAHIGDVHGIDWDLEGLITDIATIFPLPPEANTNALSQMKLKQIEDNLTKLAETLYDQREQELGSDNMRVLERLVMLRIIDNLWVEHLTMMEDMRQGIGLMAAGQRDPLVAYKREGHNLFENLLSTIQHDVAHTIYRVSIVKKEAAKEVPSAMAQVAAGKANGTKQPLQAAGKKVGRNDPCPCGSGKKYKKCCGR